MKQRASAQMETMSQVAQVVVYIFDATYSKCS